MRQFLRLCEKAGVCISTRDHVAYLTLLYPIIIYGTRVVGSADRHTETSTEGKDTRCYRNYYSTTQKPQSLRLNTVQ